MRFSVSVIFEAKDVHTARTHVIMGLAHQGITDVEIVGDKDAKRRQLWEECSRLKKPRDRWTGEPDFLTEEGVRQPKQEVLPNALSRRMDFYDDDPP